MKKHSSIPFLLIITISFLFSCSQSDKKSERQLALSGPYLGQTPPVDKPQLFAPGIINIGPHTRDITITPDGKEIYFCMSVSRYSAILFTRWGKDGWSDPEVVNHLTDPRYIYFEPCLSSDGNRLFFLSNMPDTANGETNTDEDIWVIDRKENGWGVPYNLGAPVNSENGEYFPSLTDNGTIYFTRSKRGEQVNYIYRSRFVDGKYMEPELLPENVNCGQSRYNAYISRDESFIIIPAAGMPDSYGGTDYYISFRDKKDNWSKPVNMGPKVNTRAEREFSASLSLDGKYLFFMSQRAMVVPEKITYKIIKDSYFEIGNGNPAIYWIDASFIQNLKGGN